MPEIAIIVASLHADRVSFLSGTDMLADPERGSASSSAICERPRSVSHGE